MPKRLESPVPPYAIVTMKKYAGVQARENVLRQGESPDYKITAGAGRIAHVASNTLGGWVNSRSQEVLVQEIIRPITRWFNNPKVAPKLEANNQTIHGQTISWQKEHGQDWLTTQLKFGKETERKQAIEESLASIDTKFLEDDFGVIKPEDASSASAAGVALVRIARVIRQNDPDFAEEFMARGVTLVKTAHQVVPNPERLKVILSWQYEFLKSLGKNKEAEGVLSELEKLGLREGELQGIRRKEKVISWTWGKIFEAVPVETIAKGYKD